MSKNEKIALFIVRALITLFVTVCIYTSYKIESEVEFFIFFGAIGIGITYLFAEITQLKKP